MLTLTIKVALLILLLTVSSSSEVFSIPKSKTYKSTRKLLSTMEDVKNDSDRLAVLFEVGDRRMADLIQALDDSDSDISLRAQIVIRYLGSAEGMRELNEWYAKRPNGYPVAGPIPLPLNARDYEFINSNLIGKPPETWREIGVRYIYALAIDNSYESKTMLDAMVKNARKIDDRTFVGHAIKQIQTRRTGEVITGESELVPLVLDKAFFVSPEDKEHVTSRLLAFNGNKDKALVEVYVNRGRLAEEWYHVVLSRCDQGWRFFSVTQVAVS